MNVLLFGLVLPCTLKWARLLSRTIKPIIRSKPYFLFVSNWNEPVSQ